MTRPHDKPTADKLDLVYTAQSKEELQEIYTTWAAEYDSNMLKKYGWLGPAYTVNALAEYVGQQDLILDAGCGTGLVGAELAKRKFYNLIGIDFCEAMLGQARQKRIYQALYKMDLGAALAFPDQTFDAIVAVGVFTAGHVKAGALVELSRILKRDGHFILGIRPDMYYESEFLDTLARLNLVQLFVSEVFQPMPQGEPNVNYQVVVHRFKTEP